MVVLPRFAAAVCAAALTDCCGLLQPAWNRLLISQAVKAVIEGALPLIS